MVKNPPANARDVRNMDLISGVGKIPWRRAWQSSPVFLPGESHEQRSLAGYSPQSGTELDTTERLSTSTYKKSLLTTNLIFGKIKLFH